MVKDIPGLMLRASAGDLAIPIWGYQRTVPMGGLGFTTEFSTNPNVLVTALSHREIELKLPSTVNIYRNGALLQTLRLREGRYDLRDLPAVSGTNDLTLEVIDAAGRRETISLSQYYFSGFLQPGLSQLSYNVGYPSRSEDAHRVYDQSRPVISLAHRIGILTELTAGAFFEHVSDQSVAGLSLAFPLFWGILQTDFGYSRIAVPVEAQGTATRIFYSYSGQSETESRGTRSFGLGAENRSQSFSYFASPTPVQPFAWDWFGNYTEPVSPKLSLTLGGEYSLNRSPAAEALDRAYRLHAGVNRAFDRGTSGSFTLAYDNAPNRVEITGAINFNWAFPEKQQLIRASYDSGADRSTLSWDQNANGAVGATRGRVEFDRDAVGRDLSGELGYRGNRGELLLREDLLQTVNPPGGNLPAISCIAATASPNNAEAWTYTGLIYRRQGRWRDALASFARAENLDPRNAEPAHQAPATYLCLRDWKAAVAGYNHLLGIAPDSITSMLRLACAEISRDGNTNAAKATLRKIPAGIDPDGEVSLANWNVSMLERDYEAAEKILSTFPRELFDETPKSLFQGDIAFARGDVAQARNLYENARPAIEAKVRDRPDDHPDASQRRAHLGLLYACLGRKEDAIRESRRAIDIRRERKDALETPLRENNLAMVYALVGETDQAIALIERLLSTPGAGWSQSDPSVTLTELRLRWQWDSLRNDPRFQSILTAPEPKTIY